MIKADDIIPVGTLLKTHGVKGEIVAQIERDVDLGSARCIILDIEGIYVPFFIESIRPRSASSYLIQIDGIESEDAAKDVCGKDIYLLKKDVTISDDEPGEDGFYVTDLIGYTIVSSSDNKAIGTIIDFDDTTENVVFIVNLEDGDNSVAYIPVADEFIVEIDAEHKIIVMSLPEGLIDLNMN